MHKLIAIVFFALIFPAASASAQGIPSGDLAFEATQSKSSIQATIEKGIEKAIDDMSFITKPIARGRLKDSNVPITNLKVKLTPKMVTVQHGDRNPATSNVDGTPVDWTRKSDGKKFKVTQIVKPNLIIQTFFGEDGKKVLRYRFNDDYTKVTMAVELTSPKLSGPLKYSIDFAKK